MVSNWWPGYPDPYDSLQGLLRTQDPVAYNASYYSNAEYDAIIDEGFRVSATDRETAAAMYADAIALQAKDVPLIWIYAETNQPVINRTIVGSWVGYSPAYPWEVTVYNVEPAE